jgi:hypothetical protein
MIWEKDLIPLILPWTSFSWSSLRNQNSAKKIDFCEEIHFLQHLVIRVLTQIEGFNGSSDLGERLDTFDPAVDFFFLEFFSES